ncbi:hypothetical protein D3C75_1231700 [compost metagenome]
MADLQLAVVPVNLPQTRGANHVATVTLDDGERQHSAGLLASQGSGDVLLDRIRTRNGGDLEVPQFAIGSGGQQVRGVVAAQGLEFDGATDQGEGHW